MKTILLTIVVVLSASLSSAGNYETVMKENIDKMYQSSSSSELETLAAKFYRIGEAEKEKWIPYYYAAYSYVTITFSIFEDTEETDRQLDKAQEMLNKALKLAPDESELYVLQGLIHSMRITTPTRGMKYSMLSNEALAQAEKLNPNNPRLWFCKAQNVLYTPAMFGGGEKKARPLYEKAARLFQSFEAPHALWPDWGEEINAQQIEKIKP
ncbi:hypothetical protein ACT29H_09190 [Thermophagus sp. OGC60D27]|uniref:hypothetical protein n=1 Tax=Thermophagus sp. OGC60D27 TaxID=3458415 RepID=UPI004037D7A8